LLPLHHITPFAEEVQCGCSFTACLPICQGGWGGCCQPASLVPYWFDRCGSPHVPTAPAPDAALRQAQRKRPSSTVRVPTSAQKLRYRMRLESLLAGSIATT